MRFCRLNKGLFVCAATFAACCAYQGAIVSRDDSGTCGENLTWSFNSETSTMTIRGNGTMTNYYNDFGPPWQDFKSAISYIILEEGVTSVGRQAFSNCYGLSQITIPSTVTNIGDNAFSNGWKVVDVTIPLHTSFIGWMAFAGCDKMKHLTILSKSATISAHAFHNCRGLENVTMPNGVSSIESSAFNNCEKISSLIYLGTKNPCASAVTIPHDSSLEFVCVVEDFESDSFCGINVVKSDACKTLFEENNQCLIVSRNGTVQKKSEVIEWEKNSAGCLDYYCDNHSGLNIRSACNIDGETNYACVNDACIDYEKFSEKEKVEIEIEETSISEWNSTAFILNISELSGIEANKIEIRVDIDDDGQVRHIIVMVDNERDVKVIVNAIQTEVKKCGDGSGNRCWLKGAQYITKELSVSEACGTALMTTLLLMTLMATFTYRFPLEVQPGVPSS